MNWIKIDSQNIPQGEVLAANFGRGTYGFKEKIIGTLYESTHTDGITCENESELLNHCTHYIDIHAYDVV